MRRLPTPCANVFNSTDLDLRNAQSGTFALTPTPSMMDVLKRDYDAITTMIFGEVAEFSSVLEGITKLEFQLNSSTKVTHNSLNKIKNPFSHIA